MPGPADHGAEALSRLPPRISDREKTFLCQGRRWICRLGPAQRHRLWPCPLSSRASIICSGFDPGRPFCVFPLYAKKKAPGPGGREPVCWPGDHASEIHQFHVKDQPGVRRDEPAACTARAVPELRWNDEDAVFPLLHHGQAFIPALDDHAGADRKLDGFPPAARAVELPVVAQEPACVVYLDLVSRGDFDAAMRLCAVLAVVGTLLYALLEGCRARGNGGF